MANKQIFTPQEWTKILEGVVLSGMAVTAAEPSGIIGLLKELFASAGMLAKAKSNPHANPLIKDVVVEFESSEGRGKMQEALKKRFAGASSADVRGRSIDVLREVSALVDAKAPRMRLPLRAGWRHQHQGRGSGLRGWVHGLWWGASERK